MQDSDFEELSRLILQARRLTNEARQPCWTVNAEVHVRQSHLMHLLRDHPTLRLVEGAGARGGRIEIVGPDGVPLLLKPAASIKQPDNSAVKVGQQQLPGLGAGTEEVEQVRSQKSAGQPHLPGVGLADEPRRLLAYDVLGDTDVVFYEGWCRRVKYLGWVEDQADGDLRLVSRAGDRHEDATFDQQDGDDWIAHLRDPGDERERARG